MRWRFPSLLHHSPLCGAVLAGALGACAPPEPPPTVILLVADTMRADRLGANGNARGLTPFLDTLAARGVRFEAATSSSSWTMPAIASLFTSRHSSQHLVTSFDSKLAEAERTLAESLRAGGYDTAGFTANFRLGKPHGYAQGFDHWQAFFAKSKVEGKARAQRLHRAVYRWLDARTDAQRAKPLFLYMHYMEPHSPYVPPMEFRRRFGLPIDHKARARAINDALSQFRWEELRGQSLDRLRALYDGEIASLDSEIRKFLYGLGARGLLDNSIVILTSDHGEEFREHGGMLHGRTLFEESVRIPLLIVPWTGKTRRVVSERVSLIDLAPTLVDLLGLPPEPTHEGRSLTALMRGEGGPADVRLELLRMDEKRDGRTHSGGLLRGDEKLLLDRDGEAATYHLTDDPKEARPQPVDAPLLEAFRARSIELVQRANPEAESQPLDDEMIERLRTLGYVAD